VKLGGPLSTGLWKAPFLNGAIGPLKKRPNPTANGSYLSGPLPICRAISWVAPELWPAGAPVRFAHDSFPGGIGRSRIWHRFVDPPMKAPKSRAVVSEVILLSGFILTPESGFATRRNWGYSERAGQGRARPASAAAGPLRCAFAKASGSCFPVGI